MKLLKSFATRSKTKTTRLPLSDPSLRKRMRWSTIWRKRRKGIRMPKYFFLRAHTLVGVYIYYRADILKDTIDEYHKVQSTLLPEDQEKVPGDRELVEGLKEVARELIEVECQLGKVANQLMTARHKMALRMTDT